MTYALDTNALVYFFKGLGHVADRLLAHPPSAIAIPSIVLYEIELGIAKSTSPEKRMKQLHALLEVVRLLPLAAREAREAASIRADLERRGQPIGPYDTLIAGTARAHNAILVTHNVGEFSRVEDLRCEDWY